MRFQIRSLTETQRKCLSSLKEGRDTFLSTRTESGKSLTYECFRLFCLVTVVTLHPDCDTSLKYNEGTV